MNINLTQTCGQCPEQYECFDDAGNQIGYLRLRHGRFTVEYPDCGGELIYTARPKGDGGFYEDERDFYIGEAKKAIINKIVSEGNRFTKD